jgi:hypothetical protein
VPGVEGRAIDDDMLRAHAEHNIASVEIGGEGRWQRLLKARTTEAGARRADLHYTLDEIHRWHAEKAGHKLRRRLIVDLERVPSCSILPLLMTTMRSAIVMASAWSCVT